MRSACLTLSFGEEPGIFELRRIELLEGDSFALWRKFENGIAIMNGTAAPITVDPARLDPERRYLFIDGSVMPEVNSGKAVERPIDFRAFDGRILLVCSRAHGGECR